MSAAPGPDGAAADALRHDRLSGLVVAALARPENERRAWLAQECADDPTLADEVLALLDLAGDATACLPAGELLAGMTPEDLAPEGAFDGAAAHVPPDARVPGYTLLRVLGQGGMGTVYEAEQHAPRRHVALKLLGGVGVAGEALRRFAREAQILGQLQHPGLCQVYEIGRSASGEPFFAMELVDGLQLLDHAEQAGLDRSRRLALARAVCDAVAHAHERGVVHRDLKPDNILVTADGRPKVVDFGIARATELTVAATLLTSAGAVVGTVAYMSPEQAGGRTDIDARADVFALGVVLFELLTGARPCQTTGLSLPQALHVIQRDDHTRAVLAHPDLDGDLRTILAKALEHDPARRYAHAGALADDIRRYLMHQPIVAKPPSLVYQVRKFTRRHRVLVAASLVVFASLLTGAVVALDQARRASRGEELANQRAEEADRQAYRATLTAVQELVDDGRFQQAAAEFAKLPANRRDWITDHFAAVLDERFGQVLWEGEAHGAAVSPDGRWAFTSSTADDGRPVLLRFSLPDGALAERLLLDARPLALPREVPAFARAAAIFAHPEGVDVELVDSADGTPLGRLRSGPSPLGPLRAWELIDVDAAGRTALLHGPGSAQAWDLVEGRPMGPQIMSGLSTDLSPDGGRIASASNGLTEVFDTTTGATVWQTPRCLDGESSVVFAPDGRAVYTAGMILDAVVRKWSLDDGGLLGELPLEGCGGGDSWAVSADGGVVAVAPNDTHVVLFDGALRGELGRLGLPHCTGTSLALDARGERLVAALGEYGLRTWDLRRSPARDVLGEHGTYVYSVAFSPDGRRVASGCFGHRVRVWDVASRRLLACFDEDFGAPPEALAWTPDGRRICMITNAVAYSLDADTGEPLARLELDGDSRALAIRPTGRAEVAVATADDVRLLDPRTLQVLRRVPGRLEVAWSPDGSLLATATDDGHVVVLDADDLSVRFRGEAPVRIGELAFDDTGTRLACLGDEELRVLDSRGEMQCIPMLAARPMCLAWLPGDRSVIVGQHDGGLSVWDLASSERVIDLGGHRGYVKDVDLSPDDHVLATAGAEGTVRLWHAK